MKCPKCDEELVFNIDKQLYICTVCGRSFKRKSSARHTNQKSDISQIGNVGLSDKDLDLLYGRVNAIKLHHGLFATIWFGIILLFFIVAIVNHTLDAFVFFVLTIFVAAGVMVLLNAIREARTEKQRIEDVVSNGIVYHGIIVEHVADHSVQMEVNNKPVRLLALHIRYYDKDGMIRETVSTTGDNFNNIRNYPLNSAVKFILDPRTNESIYIGFSDEKIDVDSLAIADIESNNLTLRRNFVSCGCPKCGATIMLANHGTAKCQFCGQLISFDDFGAADDIYNVSVQARAKER